MKTKNYLLIVVLFLLTIKTNAQTDEINDTEYKDSKFSISVYANLGYATINPDHGINYNLDVNSGEILLNYKFYKNLGFSSGIGYTYMSGNGTDQVFNYNDVSYNKNFYHSRGVIKIPLNFTYEYKLNDNLNMQGRFGVYTQTIVFDEYQFVGVTLEDIYEGWNFGTGIGLDILYKTSSNSSIGLSYNGQSDFTKFESKNSNQKQKIIGTNTFGFILRLNL
ncbi:hypothetical protein [Aureivirga sp. CE67]|uniref:hypothetical protein n=1 Tax=Aureivirga sp. CE67 TaxID=1788983 RepID=UPI0018C906E7|nr:hypothetical protein [Aureivirga sp. CE67]